MNIFIKLALILLVFSCQSDRFSEQDYVDINYQPGEENLVSQLSIDAFTADKAFGRGIPGLSELELSFFGVGNAMFDQSWVSSPATTTSRDGLGPLFNARACSACHLRDGRGMPLLENGMGSQGFLLRFSTGNDPVTGPIPSLNYGDQLQDDANLGIREEGSINVNFDIIEGNYPDGTAYQLRKPNYTVANQNYGSTAGLKQSPRIGQQVIGLGFIDALSELSILKNEDINDANADGISGKANRVWNVKANKTSIGRFGWKANQPNLEQQIAAAFNGDMGLTTSIFPNENCPDGIDCSTLSNGNNPGENVEVNDRQFERMMIYQAAISVPKRRNVKDLNVLKGKKIFNQLACVACHIDKFTTSNYNLLPQLENIVIRPYSDFLLHDMGSGLADDRADFLANGSEWRTQPLWGLGLIESVNKHTFLLHDGRARNIEEAILWHDGEAKTSKSAFMNLPVTDRQFLIDFLNTL